MKKTYSVLSTLVLSGAVGVMAPQAWSQSAPSTGSGSSAQKSTDSRASDMQAPRDQSAGAASSRHASSSRMSKDKVKEVQAALKSKGMDPGPEDGVLGPKTQQAL